MVLIGAAFFHRRYLQLFQEQPQAVHALVDETQNCDDIATNFAVALYLRKKVKSLGSTNKPSGVFVKPVDLRNLEKDARSGYQGMWHRPEHLLQRSYCLNKLTEIYGFMPLCYSNLMVSQFGFPSYANHKSRGWGPATSLAVSLCEKKSDHVTHPSYFLVTLAGSWTLILCTTTRRIFYTFLRR